MSRACSGVWEWISESAISRSRFDFPDWVSPSTTRCGSVAKSRTTGASASRRCRSVSPPRSDQPRRAASRPAAVPAAGGSGARPVPLRRQRRPSTSVPDSVGKISRGRRPVHPGQRGSEMQALAGDTPTRLPFGHVGRGAAVHFGLERFAEAQLEPPAEQVAQRGADVDPAVGGDDDMDAVAQAASREIDYRRFERRRILPAERCWPSITRNTSPYGSSTGPVACCACR